jgi:two-component system sensor histidine kinase/response regulator
LCRQIILNLVSNAVKFTDKGHVIVSAKLQLSRDDEVIVMFEVIDSGIGISESGLNSLFQRFSQVDSSNSRKFGGTGLGLYISKQLVEAMGGSIGVESQQGVGTVFTFTVIPFADSSKQNSFHFE